MVKGSSKRVVVVDSPDPRYFEQAIFIVRSSPAGEGVSARELVEEARRVARNYARGGRRRFSHRWELKSGACLFVGAASVGLLWLLVSML